jgi:Protein of unknown function (DUF2934)
MPASDRNGDQAVRETAYFIWENEGRPEGPAFDHWIRAIMDGSGEKQGRHEEPLEDEEKVLAGRPDVNMPSLLTKDVPGG